MAGRGLAPVGQRSALTDGAGTGKIPAAGVPGGAGDAQAVRRTLAVGLNVALGAAVLAELAAFAALPMLPRRSDAAGYWHLAQVLETTGQYPPEAYRVPVYPLFLTGLLWLHLGGLVAPAQGALAAGCVLLLWRLVIRSAGPWAGAAYLGAQVTLVHLPLFTRITMTEVLFCFLTAAWLYLHTASWRGGPAWWAAAGGLTAGLAMLTRPILLPSALLVYGWTAATGRRRAAVLGAGLAVVPLLLWGWRCARVVGHFVLGEAVLGINLYLGNYSGAIGFSAGAIAGPPTYPTDQRLLHVALHWIATHPWAFAVLTLRRAWLFWTWPADWMDALTMRAGLLPHAWALALRVQEVVTLVAAATCAWAACRCGLLRRETGAPVLAAAGLWAATWPFFVEARFRLPAALLVVAAAAATLPLLRGHRQGRRDGRRPTVAGGVAARYAGAPSGIGGSAPADVVLRTAAHARGPGPAAERLKALTPAARQALGGRADVTAPPPAGAGTTRTAR